MFEITGSEFMDNLSLIKEVIKNKILDEYDSETLLPTLAWIRADLDRKLHGWTKEMLQKVPISMAIKQEAIHGESHVVLYHATRPANYALDRLSQILAQKINKRPRWTWIRPLGAEPKIRIGKCSLSSIDNFILTCGKNMRASDGINGYQYHVLACSPTLCQNSNIDALESTMDYYFNTGSANAIDFDKLLGALISQVLPNAKISHEEIKTLKKEFNIHITKFQDILSDESISFFGGIIYQIFIKKSIMDSVAYLSWNMGKSAEGFDKPSRYLERLPQILLDGNKDEEAFENAQKIQVRLVLPLMDSCFENENIKVAYLTSPEKSAQNALAELDHAMEIFSNRLLSFKSSRHQYSLDDSMCLFFKNSNKCKSDNTPDDHFTHGLSS